MNDHIDDGEAGRLDDGQEESFDLDPEPEEFDEIDKAYRRAQLQWLADRGLCSWSEAVEYFAGPLVPQPEYERITRNYAPVNSGGRFTVCRPDEYPTGSCTRTRPDWAVRSGGMDNQAQPKYPATSAVLNDARIVFARLIASNAKMDTCCGLILVLLVYSCGSNYRVKSHLTTFTDRHIPR